VSPVRYGMSAKCNLQGISLEIKHPVASKSQYLFKFTNTSIITYIHIFAYRHVSSSKVLYAVRYFSKICALTNTCKSEYVNDFQIKQQHR
jgi:hypothetical protein